MKPRLIVYTFLSLCTAGAGACTLRGSARMDTTNGLASIVASEREFARTAVERGVREAFLAYLAETSVLFRPRPVDGRSAVQAWPEGRGWLQWEPAYAGVSRAGDLGFSTGPYIAQRDSSLPAHHGHFLTLWRRQRDGSWKVELDHGISYAHPHQPERFGHIGRVRTIWPTHAGAGPASSRAPADELLDVDQVLANSIQGRGGQAYLLFAHPQIRLYRDGVLPVEGADAARDLARLPAGSMTFVPEGAGASAAADLGYTYGTYRRQGPEAANVEGAYTRVWIRAGGGWRVLIDLAADFPRRP